MEGIEMPHTDKYKEIMNDWNYDTSRTLTSLLIWDLKILSAWFLLYRVYIGLTVLGRLKYIQLSHLSELSSFEVEIAAENVKDINSEILIKLQQN
jgi:hypothetical protein